MDGDGSLGCVRHRAPPFHVRALKRLRLRGLRRNTLRAVKPKPVNPSSPLAGPSIETILFAVRRTGLVPRGALRLEPGERNGALAGVRTIVLAGMAGRDGWSAFAASPEAHDGVDHPLDRWSRRVIGRLARELGAQALFPFGGPPYLPFQQWARRAEPVHPSPIGLLIHPRYGLWHSYRGALGFPEALDVPEPAAVPNPCESCSGRWCLKACPVGAFSGPAMTSPPASGI